MPKLVKADYITLIEDHLAKQGKRLTNLKKATLPKLKELCEVYDIKYDEKEIILERIGVKKEHAMKKDQEKKEDEERSRKYKEEKKRQKEEWEGLTEEDKEKVITYVVIEKQKVYLNDYFKNRKRNEKLKHDTDVMEKKFRDDGKMVERIKDNHLIINGINLIQGFLVEPFDWEYEYASVLKNAEELNCFNIIHAIAVRELE